ncbi:hypothetical protein [Mycobacterium heckeshornense]|uniref:hypothetical protein n=1 Tax=Mycobacterium heckeshornense TaxID=110505 RepID=UPI001910E7B2|nr:hypothetical protein [Mycobacterium heckeshornense]MCV7037000.1 hypothetical protein [Mycobacterium heckeshornense]
MTIKGRRPAGGYPGIHLLVVGVGMGMLGMGDMLGIGDIGGIEGMFFMASFIDAQHDLSSLV